MKKNAILLVILIAVVALTTLEFQKKILKKSSNAVPIAVTIPVSTTPQPEPTLVETPIDRTLEGEYVCLPDKEQQSVNTTIQKCTYGLKLRDGSYVALNVGEFDDKEDVLKRGSKIRVNGKFVSIEQLNQKQWGKYSVKGIIRATTITEI